MKLLSSNVRYLFSSRASTMHLRSIIVPTFNHKSPPSGGELPVAHRSCLPCYNRRVNYSETSNPSVPYVAIQWACTDDRRHLQILPSSQYWSQIGSQAEYNIFFNQFKVSISLGNYNKTQSIENTRRTKPS